MEISYPVKITAKTAELIGVNQTLLYHLDTTAVLKPKIAPTSRRAFLGVPAIGTSNKLANLSTAQRRQLEKIGIKPSHHRYVKGLINTPIKYGSSYSYVDVYVLKTYLDRRIACPTSIQQKAYKPLIQVAATLNQKLIENDEQSSPSLILAERNIVLAQLGFLFLPIGFACSLHEPLVFIKNTAPYLGLYAIAKKENKCQQQ